MVGLWWCWLVLFRLLFCGLGYSFLRVGFDYVFCWWRRFVGGVGGLWLDFRWLLDLW